MPGAGKDQYGQANGRTFLEGGVFNKVEFLGTEAMGGGHGDMRNAGGMHAKIMRNQKVKAPTQGAKMAFEDFVRQDQAAKQAHAEVAKQGCRALANLAFNNADNQKAIASAGGVEAVVAALRAHGGAHAGVAQHGCWALKNLAIDDDIALAIGSAGGVEAIVPALRAHGEGNAEVAENGCTALAYLCWDTTANAAAIAAAVSAGAVPLVEAAVRAHPSNTLLQEWGPTLLTKLKA